MTDAVEALRTRIEQASANREALQIVGGDSKRFLGREPVGEPLSTTSCAGIVSYEPTELVLTARSGTPLAELEQAVEQQGQMLPFEPPHFSPNATLGGAVACGLSGPRRPFTGSVRDFVLGVKIINGNGELLSFGGQVMKNVAGYDVSRLMTGAMGCLGLLVEISLKVLPRPPHELTVAFDMDADSGVEQMLRLAGSTAPLSGACHVSDRLYIRLSGSASGVDAAAERLHGDTIEQSEVWTEVRELTHTALDDPRPLWRLSVPATAPLASEHGAVVIDWGGAQRWLRTDAEPQALRDWAEQAGGHATLFKDGSRETDTFHPLQARLFALHRRLKAAFDPNGVLNPGRLYAGL